MSGAYAGKQVLMMAGGTGGHVFPALAVAAALAEQGATVAWLGTAAGIEARLVPAADIPLHTIDVAGLRGKRLTTLLAAPLAITRALFQAHAVVKRVNPDLVIGMGGFASGPGGLMARVAGRRLVIHEQNAAAGLTNRLLARIAHVTLQAFPDTFVAGRGAETVGNPVRADILSLAAPEQRLMAHEGPLRLLVLGGSGGALAINEQVPEALAEMPAEQRPTVWHQAGRTLAAAERAYEQHGVTAHVEAFIDNMAAAYDWADMVVCRAGALTVAELAAAGLGALLIPFPHAVDDHQAANARHLVDAGAALMVRQNQLSPARLAEALTGLGRNRAELLVRAQAARRVAWPDSTAQIVAACTQPWSAS